MELEHSDCSLRTGLPLRATRGVRTTADLVYSAQLSPPEEAAGFSSRPVLQASLTAPGDKPQ